MSSAMTSSDGGTECNGYHIPPVVKEVVTVLENTRTMKIMQGQRQLLYNCKSKKTLSL